MMLAKGPRPRPVRLFVGVVLLNALWSFVQRLTHLDQPQVLHGHVFNPATDHDLMVVVFSAQLTIVMIPLAMVWFLASNLARWLVSVMSVATAPALVMALASAFHHGAINAVNLVLALLPQLAFLLLFTPDGARWFAADKGREAVFD